MATTNLGRVAIVAQGEYNPSTQYEKLDIVRYAEVSYLVLRAVKGVVPTDGEDYSLLAGRGESAYEVAVDNGYVGSELDWLAYIRADGSISALQKFMTNDSDTEVSVPEYGNIPSLQGYISQMFTNGGLPATPFATKALMTASALVDGNYAMVTDETANNGLYVKTAGAWVKSAYDPLKSAQEDIAVAKLDAFEYTDRLVEKPANIITEPSVENKIITLGGLIADYVKNNARVSVATIRKGVTYTVTKYEGGNCFRVGTTNKYPVVGDDYDTPIHLYSDDNNPTEIKSHTFTNSDDAKYVVVCGLSGGSNDTNLPIPNIQVEEGSESTPYSIAEDINLSPELLLNIEKAVKTELLDKSKNIYSGNLIRRKLFTSSGAGVIDSNDNATVIVEKIESGRTYTVKKYAGGDIFRVGLTNTQITKESPTVDVLTLKNSTTVVSDESTFTFTNTDNYQYIVVGVLGNTSNGIMPEVQIELGSLATEYESPRRTTIKPEYIPDGNIVVGEKDVVPVTKFTGVAFNANNPPSLMHDISPSSKYVTYRVSLKSGDKINIRRLAGDRFALATRLTPNPVTDYTPDIQERRIPLDPKIFDNATADFYSYENTDDSSELWVYANANSAVNVDFKFEYETDLLVAADGYELVADRLKGGSQSDFAIRGGTQSTLSEVEDDVYTKKEGIFLTNDAELFPDQHLTQLPYFYSRYADLVAAHPNYITSTVLGQDSLGNDLLLLNFKPERVKGMESTPLMKIALFSGLHGNEKAATFSDYNFLKKVANEWQGNEILEYFRFNVEFLVIPVVNPSGFNANTRENVNGINLNRDYPTSLGTVTTDRELETQLVLQVLKDNPDIDFLLDHHTDGYYPETNEYAYIHSSDPVMRKIFSEVIIRLSNEWKLLHPAVTQDEGVYFGSVRNEIATSLASYVRLLGIRNCLLEAMNTNYLTTGDRNEYEITSIMAVEILANLLTKVIENIEHGVYTSP